MQKKSDQGNGSETAEANNAGSLVVVAKDGLDQPEANFKRPQQQSKLFSVYLSPADMDERKCSYEFMEAYNNHILNKGDDSKGQRLDSNDFDNFPYNLTGLGLAGSKLSGITDGGDNAEKVQPADMTGRDLSNSIIDEQMLKDTPYWSGANFTNARIFRDGNIKELAESRRVIDSVIVGEYGIHDAKGLEDKSNTKRIMAVSATVLSLVGAGGVAATILTGFGKAADGSNGLSEAETNIVCSNPEVYKIAETADICKAHGFEMPEA